MNYDCFLRALKASAGAAHAETGHHYDFETDEAGITLRGSDTLRFERGDNRILDIQGSVAYLRDGENVRWPICLLQVVTDLSALKRVDELRRKHFQDTILMRLSHHLKKPDFRARADEFPGFGSASSAIVHWASLAGGFYETVADHLDGCDQDSWLAFVRLIADRMAERIDMLLPIGEHMICGIVDTALEQAQAS